MEEMKTETLLYQLIRELHEDPSGAVELMRSMSMVVRPWEGIVKDGATVVSNFRRMTVMGQEVGSLQRGFPTWSLQVEGSRLEGTQVFNTRTGEEEAKLAVDEALIERGYILME